MSAEGSYILVVDDFHNFRMLVASLLSEKGYRVQTVGSGEEGLKAVQDEEPALILLDQNLPGLSGLDVCRQLKADPSLAAIPVILVSGDGQESVVVTALELGAEDFVAKPFSPSVLLARVQAVLRRSPKREVLPEALTLRDLTIDMRRQKITVRGEEVKLSPTEQRILQFLIAHPGWVFTRSQIVSGINSRATAVTERSVDVHIVGLRKKLGPEMGALIETVRGVGYRVPDQ